MLFRARQVNWTGVHFKVAIRSVQNRTLASHSTAAERRNQKELRRHQNLESIHGISQLAHDSPIRNLPVRPIQLIRPGSDIERGKAMHDSYCLKADRDHSAKQIERRTCSENGA
jgi:hypothetical protein